MGDGPGPKLKSVTGGLGQPSEVKARAARVSERSPTSKLPEVPPTPPSSDGVLPPVPGAPKAPLPAETKTEAGQNRRLSPATTAEFAAVHPLVRKQFGRYELLMQMGSGGMATLYLARICGPQKFEKLLAVKKIHEHLLGEKDFVEMFRDEARIAALIHHPNVVSTFDLGVIDGAYFIAMEYVHGQTVKDMINAASRREDPLHWSIPVRVAAEVAKGLHAAHTLHAHSGEPLNVIHRDVSPQNILVSYDGHVKLVDFGIAYAAEKLNHTGAGKLKGKVGYMSPEQVSGNPVDHRSDIFALGIVLFEMLTMRRLFKEPNEASTILKLRAARVPDLLQLCPRCPPELSDILKRALAREPDDRYATAEAFAEVLDELLVTVNERVGRKELSGAMEDLFYERKRIKDRMHRRALANLTDTPIQGIEALDDGTSSLLIDTLSTGSAAGLQPGGSSRLLLAGMAGAVVVLMLVVGWLLLRNPSSSPSGDKQGRAKGPAGPTMTPPRRVVTPRLPPMRRRPVLPGSVVLTVRITPPDADATITFRKEVQRGAIFQAALPKSMAREEVTISAPGYLRRVVPIVLSQTLSVPVELIRDPKARPAVMEADRRRRRRRRPRPRRRPMSMLIDL